MSICIRMSFKRKSKRREKERGKKWKRTITKIRANHHRHHQTSFIWSAMSVHCRNLRNLHIFTLWFFLNLCVVLLYTMELLSEIPEKKRKLKERKTKCLNIVYEMLNCPNQFPPSISKHSICIPNLNSYFEFIIIIIRPICLFLLSAYTSQIIAATKLFDKTYANKSNKSLEYY